MTQRIVIGFTGATGQIYGIRLLEMLQDRPYETHLILSRAAKLNIEQEADQKVAAVRDLADVCHDNANVAAPLASGSFQTAGMVVVPCSMKTLSQVAHGNAENLLTRAADVTLKERRRLILMPREKPLNRIHLENMLKVTDAGGIIMPPFPSFYNQPETLQDIVDRTVARTLSLLDIDVNLEEWDGLRGGTHE